MTHLIFAELSGLERGGLICAIIFGALSSVIALIALLKKQETVISPQPLAVTIVEEMHKRFASKEAFDSLSGSNTQRHAQLFNRIDQVEREARVAMDQKFTELNVERRETLERLNAQFAFIRENIAAINRELQLRGKQ